MARGIVENAAVVVERVEAAAEHALRDRDDGSFVCRLVEIREIGAGRRIARNGVVEHGHAVGHFDDGLAGGTAPQAAAHEGGGVVGDERAVDTRGHAGRIDVDAAAEVAGGVVDDGAGPDVEVFDGLGVDAAARSACTVARDGSARHREAGARHSD